MINMFILSDMYFYVLPRASLCISGMVSFSVQSGGYLNFFSSFRCRILGLLHTVHYSTKGSPQNSV